MAINLTKKRRAELQNLAEAYQTAAEEYAQALADLASEWREEFDERSERWQESESGQQAQEKIGRVQEAADAASEPEVLDFDDF